MNKLERIASVLDVFQMVFPEDVKLAVFDTEKVIADLPGKIINIQANVGEPFSSFKETVSYRALKEQKVLREERGAELYGVAYISTAVPIFEDGKLLGVLSALVSNNKVSTMKTGAEKVSQAVEVVYESTKELLMATEDLAKQVEHIFNQSKHILQSLKESTSVLKRVQEISDQSKLLALNGTIEASRAGEHGRTFGVVASEMRKMADNSKKLAESIEQEMAEIHHATEQMDTSIEQVVAFVQRHSDTMEEIQHVFEKLSETSEELMKAASL